MTVIAVQSHGPYSAAATPAKHISLQTIKRFFKKTEKTSTCWLWLGAMTGSTPICTLSKDDIPLKKSDAMPAYRFSYLIHKGALEAGAIVTRTCCNPSCVNPDHMTLGTVTEIQAHGYSCRYGWRDDTVKELLIKGTDPSMVGTLVGLTMDQLRALCMRLEARGDFPEFTGMAIRKAWCAFIRDDDYKHGSVAEDIRAARPLYEDGSSVADIGRELEVPYATVWGWVHNLVYEAIS